MKARANKAKASDPMEDLMLLRGSEYGMKGTKA